MNKADRLEKYLNIKMDAASIRNIYNDKKVDMELSLLYRDIILTLNDLIFTTYLGDDVMGKEDRIKHFNWCWEKTVTVFKVEGFEMKDYEQLKSYFRDFYDDIFYTVPDKINLKRISLNMEKLWAHIFNIRVAKSESDVDVFIELYELFSVSIFS